MKKLLTFLTLLTLFFTTAWAETVTISYNSTFNPALPTASGTAWTDAQTTIVQGLSIGVVGVYKGSSNDYLMFVQNKGYIFNRTSLGTINSISVTYSSGTSTSAKVGVYFGSSMQGTYTSTNNQTIAGQSQTDTWTNTTTGYGYFQLSTSNKNTQITQIIIDYTPSGSTVETVATPTFSPIGGTFTEAQNVTISCATSGATIHYTTDGSTPTTSSSVYSSAIPVSTTTTIKAMAAASGMNNSDVATATYTINIPGTGTTYERVTSLSASDIGKKFIFVCEDYNAAAGTLTSQYLASQSISINNHSTTIPANSSVIEFTLSGSAGAYQFADPDGNYLTPTAAKKLSLNANGTETAAITFTNGNAEIAFATSTYGTLQYNYNGGSNSRFLNYTSSQTAIQLYKEVTSTPAANDVYIIGQANGNGWDTSVGVQMTYSNNNDNYTADIYCTGENSGTDEGYSFFLFAKSLPYDWNNTGNLYGSGGNGSYWGIGGNGESAFGSEIPLYEGSKDSFRLAAGLYTVTVDLDYTGHQYTTKSVNVTKRDVTMTISPSSNYFSDTQTVTMASNLTAIGGKIYYTTNGNDPRDQYSGRQEYTGQLTISETTTFKAVAFVGNLYSDVVEKTYTKTPAAPVITPASCTFSEPFQVTITAQSGATIYYTTDGSNPTDQSTLYTGPFIVSTTTTVKAKAYVNGVYGATATETYTYSNVQPGTGDFELVTSASQLVAGNEYIILEAGGNYAMGEVSNNKGQATDDYTLTGTLGASGSKVTAGSGVNVLTLGGTSGAWTLQQSDNSYINITSNNTNVTESTSATTVTIEIDNSNYATIKGYSTRQILYQIKSGNNVTHIFGNYATSNANGAEYEKVYLYTRASNAVQNPVFSPVPGIYNVDIDVTITCPTDGATIYYTTDGTDPTATTGTEYTGEMVVTESTTFKAIAVKDGNTSSVVTAAYTINKSTEIATVTLTYSEPFTAGIGDFTIDNVSGFSPVWSLDGNYGVKGTSYSPNTDPTNNAAVSRLVSPIIDMTGSVLPSLTFSHQINKYFNDVTSQCKVFIRETSNGTSGTWKQIPITFSDPVAAGGWTNDIAVVDLTDVNGVSYADKKVQISFLYTNPTEGSGAGTWEIQNFVVEDLSEYRMVNNIAEFLALDNGITAKFKNPVTVLYDYAQYSSSQYHEYIWVKDESGYMQFYMVPTLNSDENSGKDGKAAYYENGDIIPAGFVVTKNYYEYGKYVQAYTNDALNADFAPATQKGLADPEYMDFADLNTLDATNAEDVATWCNRYITLEKIKIASKSGKNFRFANESGTVNACVGYNKYNGDGSLLKDGTTPADVTVPGVSNTYYDVKGIIQLWQGGWEFMPIEFTEWKEQEMTLRTLCSDGVEGTSYKISNNLLGVYASADGTMLWVKDDDGQSIFEKDPADPYTDNFAIEHDGNTRLEQAHYDQSNWCMLMLNDESAGDYVGKIIKGGSIQGRFTDKTNPTLEGVSLTEEAIYSNGSYAPNYYIPANFYGDQSCHTSQHGQPGHGDYFFMAPKPQEYAMVVWAVFDDEHKKFIMSTDPNRNTHMFEGEFTISFELNTGASSYSQLQDGYGYDFQAIIRKAASTTGSKAAGDFVVYPLDLDEGQDPVTSINDINTGNGVVKSVKYVNVAGIVSDKPFQGINIVVTEYTDGTRTTTKMLRK